MGMDDGRGPDDGHPNFVTARGGACRKEDREGGREGRRNCPPLGLGGRGLDGGRWLWLTSAQ